MRNGDQGDALVLFGATGDLAHRKIFPAVQALIAQGLDLPIVAIARGGKSREWLIDRIADGLQRFGDPRNSGANDKLFADLRYIDGDYRDIATFNQLKKELGVDLHRKLTRDLH